MSGGVIAVAVPLYLAESLSAAKRGRGTAIFQFMITFGVVVASLTGWYFIREVTLAIDAAHGNPWLDSHRGGSCLAEHVYGCGLSRPMLLCRIVLFNRVATLALPQGPHR